ncbi:MAG: hypothetical protein K2H13_02515 [Eubacterium sp.]|nr:hypothetical protein [Eubacterium sp.]MDE6155726.1 hypothetical protein [Eubacterium sp.]
MDFIKEWTFTICITLIISVVFSLLTPKGNMGRFFKIILATFIFLSFIYPLKSDEIDITFPEFNISEIEVAEREAYESAVETQIEKILADGGYVSCSVKNNISLKENEIYINSIKISIPSSYDKQEVKNYLFDSAGIIAEVYYVGE